MADTDERKTPQPLWEELDDHFRFCWDLAATKASSKTGSGYFGPDHISPMYRDALILSWYDLLMTSVDPRHPCAWLNPPYSRGMVAKFLEKARREAELGLTTVALVRGDVSTDWFHDLVLTTEHYFQRGRNKFEGAPLDSKGRLAPDFYGSVLAIYRPSLPSAGWTR